MLKEHNQMETSKLKKFAQFARRSLLEQVTAKLKLVLADEPTGNLDPGNAHKALALLRELCCDVGSALLLVSHDENVIGGFEENLDWSNLNRAFAEAMND